MTYEWKPGDIVCHVQNHIQRAPAKHVVERVTPKGFAILKGDATSQYKPDGYRRGATGWERPRIEPWTEAHNVALMQHYRALVAQTISSHLKGIPRSVLRRLMEEALTEPPVIPT